MIALLQLLVVALASRFTSGQDSIFFPGDSINGTSPVVATTRFQPMLSAELRSSTPPPRCAMRAGQDPDSPCLEDADYNDNLKADYNYPLAYSPLERERISAVEICCRSSILYSIVKDPVINRFLNDEIVEFRTRPVTTRLGVSETPVCQSEETLIFPKRAKSASDEWVFVLNHENVEQALRVEKCINEGAACEFESPLPPEIRTVCRQKYVYRRMLTVGSNKIQPEEVLMPSCCVCYRKTSGFDIGSRTRVPGTASGSGLPVTPSGSQPFVNNQPILAPPANFGNQPAPPFNHRTIRRRGFFGPGRTFFNNWQ
ncbi:uncharacterized protein LOC119582346 [Penaeus monodon]|uniref:uncharacterized protein LOC119582346 n=1 Tax=Penaeus monodon TaxID=6687 RepID=UPI0018A7AB0B|nr:uncharacterized protein LOC119582346 [Penaeus monodon]